MKILALDLGTSLGVAIFKDGKFISGTKKLGTYKEKFGARFHEFRKWLVEIIEKHNIETVYFERVYGHKGVEAAHCYGGFLYTLASVCFQQNIPCIGLKVQEIKKFMTGKGNATKEEMIRAAQTRGFNPQDDNAADAIAILLLGLSITQKYKAREFREGTDHSIDKKVYKGSFLGKNKNGSRAPGSLLAAENFQRMSGTPPDSLF